VNPGSEEYRRPESVLVVVYTSNADVLLLNRKKPFEFWQSITGSLLQDESHAAAAARELQEETGIAGSEDLVFSGNSRVFTIDARWRYRFEPGVEKNTEYEWRLCLPRAVDIQIDPEEHTAYQWLPIDEGIDAVWSWTNKEALERLRAEL